MSGIFIGNFYHDLPQKTFDKNGNRQIISYYCFGPIEIFVYGINYKNEYYFEHTYSLSFGDYELKTYKKIITKEEMIKAIDEEIKLCENHKAYDISNELKIEKEIIENNLGE